MIQLTECYDTAEMKCYDTAETECYDTTDGML